MSMENLQAHNTQGVRGWAVAKPHPSGDGSFYGYIVDGLDEQTAKRFAAAFRMERALSAITARINGEWDHPDLLAFGPLLPDTAADCARLAKAGLSNEATPPTAEDAPFSEEAAQRLCAGDKVTWVETRHVKNRRRKLECRGQVAANRFPEIHVWLMRGTAKLELKRVYWDRLTPVKPKPKKAAAK